MADPIPPNPNTSSVVAGGPRLERQMQTGAQSEEYRKYLLQTIIQAMKEDSSPRPERAPWSVEQFSGERRIPAGAHGDIPTNPQGPLYQPTNPEAMRRAQALAGARGLVRGGMNKPSEVDAATSPQALNEWLSQMPPEQRMLLIQKLQGASKPQM